MPDQVPEQVRGWFHDRERVAHAVDELMEGKIPQDQIRVSVEDRSGTTVRVVPVKGRMGVFRGAMWGAAGGAAFGLVAAFLTAAGALNWTGIEPLQGGDLMAAGDYIAALRGMLAGAAAGVPLGGVWGLARWRGAMDLSDDELRDGAAVVTVEGAGIVDRAEHILQAQEPARLQRS
jgi:hypothetical protein